MTRTAKTSLAALAAVCAALALWAPAAPAALTHPSLSSFGPSGTGAGTFGRVASVAVAQSTQDVYVYDGSEGGRIYKFNASGEPVDFSGLAGNVIENVGFAGGPEVEVAVDDSSGPASGDIYVANNNEVVVYSAAGVKLGTLSGGEMCGVAVDSAGHVYVGNPETVKQYVPTVNPVTNGDYVSSLSGLQGPCNVAVDGEGDVYAATYSGGVRKYAPSQFNTKEESAVSIPPGVAFDEQGRTLTVDRSAAVLYADAGTVITQYDDSGEPMLQGSFGRQLEESFGVAVNETSNDVYVGSKGRVEIYGPATTVADVSLEPASGVSQSSATVHGTANPLGIAVSACDFEYWVERESEATSAACTPTPGSGNSAVAVSATLSGIAGNSTYHYRLAVSDADGTNYSEVGTFTTLPVAPILTGQPAISNVMRTTVLVAPTIDDGNSPSTAVVQFAAEGAYAPEAAQPYAAGTSSPVFELSALSGPKSARPMLLSGLLAGTTYHYRVIVTNDQGTTYGPDYTFTTAAPTPPALETAPASSVTATTAVLSGIVLAATLQTSYEFEVGTDTSYSGAEIFGNAGQSAAPEAVSANLQFLVPGTTYHYRLVATNVDGTTYGPDMMFTTPGVAAPIAQPPATPLISVPTFQFPNTSGAITKPVAKAKKTTKHKKVKAKRKKTKRNAKAKRGKKTSGKR
jgi:hypothetical protein